MFHHLLHGVFYCFFLSDKLEPFVIVTAVDPAAGKLHRLTHAQVDDLQAALRAYKDRYGVSDESYHYTALAERDDTEAFSRAGGAAAANKAHSAHFHLKMRIATSMCVQLGWGSFVVCSFFPRCFFFFFSSSFFLSSTNTPHQTTHACRYRDRFPVLGLMNLDKLRQVCEPVRYNYSRETIPYERMIAAVLKDAV
jgi:hypothetical protein